MQSKIVEEYEIRNRRILVTGSFGNQWFETAVNRSNFQTWVVNTDRHWLSMDVDEFETPTGCLHFPEYWHSMPSVFILQHLTEYLKEFPCEHLEKQLSLL